MKNTGFSMKALCIIFLFFFAKVSYAAEIKLEIQSNNLLQYQKIEWDITLEETFENPYLQEEISADLEILAPSGKKLVQPCFFVSGKSGEKSKWKARFTPREAGKYYYKLAITKGNKKSESEKQSFDVIASIKRGFLNLNDYWTFRFDNGELFRGIGENICWESRSNDDSKFFKELHEQERFNYEYMLRKLAVNGGNYTRIWMCPWNLPIESKIVSENTNRYENSSEYFNPGAIVKMERLINLADSLGIYIMLTLDQAGNYQGGNWDKNNYNIKNGGYASDLNEFFSNQKSKQQYKNRLRYLIARWGYSPSIGAWEFFNEVDYVSFEKDTSKHLRTKAVVAWHDEMSSYLKQVDPYGRIITTSISHIDVPGLNDIKNIDINQKHIYKHTSGIPKVIEEYAKKHQKPYIIGEFGYEWDWSKNFNEYGAEMDNDFKRGLWYGLFSPTPVLPMSWWWEFFENRGMMEYFKGVRTISDMMLTSGKGKFVQLPVNSENDKIITYGAQCGFTLFIYVYNQNSKDIITDISFAAKGLVFTDANLYSCENKDLSKFEKIEKIKGNFKAKEMALKAGEDYVLIINAN